MKAIILARVSDKQQDSNEAQVVRVSDYVKFKELTTWKTIEIEESSTKGDREKFQEVIKIIQEAKEPIALVVDTVDRLQRGFKESVQLDELRKSGKIEIHFYRENLVIHKDSNSADLLRWDMAVMFARSYVLQLSDNVKRKFEQKRNKGEITGMPRIGYINANDENNPEIKTIIPDPERSHHVVKIFNLYSTGKYSYAMILKIITEDGLQSLNIGKRKSKKLTCSGIENILKDTFFYGMAYSKKYNKHYPHKYFPLISKELFDKCEEVRNGKSRRAKKAGQDFIFRGLITCKECGCTVTPEVKKGRFVYYSCTNAKKTCKRVYVNEKELLKPVYEVLEAFTNIRKGAEEQLIKELKKLNESESLYHASEVKRIQEDLELYGKRKMELVDTFLDKSITREIYDKKFQEYDDKLVDLQNELGRYTQADNNYKIGISTVFQLASNAKALFESSETHEKTALLKFLIQNPTLNGRKLEYTLRKPFDCLLHLDDCIIWLPGLDSNQRPSG